MGKHTKDNGVAESDIWEQLKQVTYPGFSRDIVDFGIVRDVTINDDQITVVIDLTTKDESVPAQIESNIKTTLQSTLGLKNIDVQMNLHTVPQPGETPAEKAEPLLTGVRHKIAIASGKGGVGKSTICVNIAAALVQKGYKVGVLDCDIYGPSIPLMLGVQNEKPRGFQNKIIPIEGHNMKIMSIGFFLPPDQALIWRGPMVMKGIEQMLKDVMWGDLDYLIIDMPPGTGDAQLSLSQLIQLSGSIIVTTPQEVALIDAVKGVQMFRKVNVPVLGIVENMSYFISPESGERTDIFSSGGGKRESERLGVPFLGAVPIHTILRIGGDSGEPPVFDKKNTEICKIFEDIIENFVRTLPAEMQESS